MCMFVQFPEETRGVRSPSSKTTDSYEPLQCGCWKPTSNVLQGHFILFIFILATEPSPQPLQKLFLILSASQLFVREFQTELHLGLFIQALSQPQQLAINFELPCFDLFGFIKSMKDKSVLSEHPKVTDHHSGLQPFCI